MINYIFASFFIIGILYSFITGTNISNEILTSSSKAIELIFTIIPIMCLWLGIMNIAKKSGLLDKLSKLLTPLLKIIFPEIPKNNPAFSYISINIIMNMLGVGNASTPFGLKAMKELDKDNDKKNIASNSMITFLVLNTSGLTIIPTTIISLRMMYNSKNPTIIVFACILSTICSTIGGIIIDRILARRYKN